MNKKIIVLDLDETLVHTYDGPSAELVHSKSRTEEASNRLYNIKVGNRQLVGALRPNVREFIDFCLKHFDEVIVWSAGIPTYVDEIVKILFTTTQPDRVYARDKCLLKDDLYIKPLESITTKNRTMDKMIIIDDRLTTFSTCNPYNGLLIPTFSPKLTDPSLGVHDTVLIQLMDFFLHPTTKNIRDVRDLDKSRVFEYKAKFGIRDLIQNKRCPTTIQLRQM
jgi:TFIIF-interacting CTD phosphatase-like protein